MIYRIECVDTPYAFFAYGRKDLLDWLMILKDEVITDIRKLYKNDVSDSVMEKYEKYIVKGR